MIKEPPYMKIKLKSKGFRAEEIFINDMKITNATNIQVNVNAKEIPTVTMELIPSEIEIAGDFMLLKEKSLNDYSLKDLCKAIIEKVLK